MPFFIKNAVQIIYNNNVILTGTRSVASNGLWIVNVNRPSFDEIPSCNILAPAHTDERYSDVFATEQYFCNVPAKTALRIAVG